MYTGAGDIPPYETFEKWVRGAMYDPQMPPLDDDPEETLRWLLNKDILTPQEQKLLQELLELVGTDEDENRKATIYLGSVWLYSESSAKEHGANYGASSLWGGHSLMGVSLTNKIEDAEWYEVWDDMDSNGNQRAIIRKLKFKRIRAYKKMYKKRFHVTYKRVSIDRATRIKAAAESRVGSMSGYDRHSNNCTHFCSYTFKAGGIVASPFKEYEAQYFEQEMISKYKFKYIIIE